MSSGPEFTLVEQPFIDQLVSMGWKHTTGALDHPSATGRETFREVFVQSDLRDALTRINRNPQGNAWLDDGRLTQAVTALQRLGTSKLMEANQRATTLLIKGTVVDGVEGWDKGRGQTVQYIDWDNVENNTFRVINQFRVACPAGQPKKHIHPDLVLFVNGIPLVVVECKAPGASSAMDSAIEQLQRYANRRRALKNLDFNEGNEQLFHTNQFVIATRFDEARVGTFSSQSVHFVEWKDTCPVPIADVAGELGKTKLSSQEMLVAGMLRPAHLLDIVRHFTLFMPLPGMGKRIKLVCRYQQFRAVQIATQRLLTGKTKAEDGEHDRRGGIIWHTQGSGKSLTMVFLVRKLRSHPVLRRFKVVVVTDRKDLQRQLAETATLINEPVNIVRSTRELPEMLSRDGADLVFAMIQKYNERDTGDVGEIEDTDDDNPGGLPEAAGMGLLNDSEDILVMVDEAHRSQGSALHASLLQSLPNCARIGFTGTPIIMGQRKRTHAIFGDYIDRYTIKQSEADGATVPILYEGRTVEGAVKDKGDLDQVFEDMFVERTREQLEELKKKYATRDHVMEAPALIEAKARDMLRHYVANILPSGFKAQVVTVSRRATVRYYEAFQRVRDELVAELEAVSPTLLTLPPDERSRLDTDTQFLVAAHADLARINALDFAPAFSGLHNDDVDPQGEWTTSAKIDARIDRFKRPLPEDPSDYDPKKADPLAFLIVKAMLLTGFDAPVEQVMYLDRSIKEAELLQAIARVNRTCGATKRRGFVVDYYGVASDLKDALAAYSPDDIQGALQSLKDEVPKLRDQHLRAVQVLREAGLDPDNAEDSELELANNERLLATFRVHLKAFLATLDSVLPRPEALPFVNDSKQLSAIYEAARRTSRASEAHLGKDLGAKVRRLIDEHVISLGIDPKIPPVVITAVDFGEHIDRERSPRAKASEMEHALCYHIRKHLDEDPEYYGKLSERLKDILTKFEGQWELQLEALQPVIDEAAKGRQQDDTGLDPETHLPFYGLLKAAADGDFDATKKAQLIRLTTELVDHVRQEVRLVNFWANPHAQDVLRKWLVQFLDGKNRDKIEIVEYEKQGEMADRLVELRRPSL